LQLDRHGQVSMGILSFWDLGGMIKQVSTPGTVRRATTIWKRRRQKAETEFTVFVIISSNRKSHRDREGRDESTG
jgi:hypothetical protein